MARLFWISIVFSLLLPAALISQEDPPIEEEEEDEVFDYSSLIQTEENKAFCSSRIVGQLPIKLFSVGYDFQTAHRLSPIPSSSEEETREYDIDRAQGARFALNYPVISKNNIVLNLGINYAETNYDFATAVDESSFPLAQALENNGLRTMGFTATAFKPLNSKRYIIARWP